MVTQYVVYYREDRKPA